MRLAKKIYTIVNNKKEIHIFLSYSQMELNVSIDVENEKNTFD